ncbi:polysaccharide deacetylase family protein [Roseivirga sp.]|uniref:polysaccharide deacetylase family protein n=1 Tax=Roseivirga sp. TaxID=1964215 RepID=UPI003B51E2DC
MWLWTRSLTCLTLLLIAATLTAQESSISTFVYHRFGDDRFPSTNIKLEQFEAHLKYLKENDYQVVTLSEALKRLQKRKRFPKTAVLTVDDGYLTFYQNAIPLLQQYGFTATVFVNTETVGGSDFMDWKQLQEVQELGIEIGNHSHSHAYFLNTSQEEFESDLELSETEFSTHLGRVPVVYAYPYGEWNPEMAAHLEAKGYLGAVAQNSGILYKEAPQFHLPRFPMSETYARLEDFVSKLKTLPLRVEKYEPVSSGYMGSTEKPRVNLEFKESNLKLEQLQCFIQGADCQKSIQIVKDGQVKLNVRPDRDLKRRRTLFTITVPDADGHWHWFSYLWVIPSIEE